MIPKTIHYCWFGNNPLPKNAQKCIVSWKKYCPDYKIIEWNEHNVDFSDCNFAKIAYENKSWAFVSDFVRLKVIKENGGIYLDTDVELLKNLDFLLNEKCFLASDQLGRRIATGLGFGVEKDNPIIIEMMEIYYEKTFNPEQKRELQCPILNTAVMKRHGFGYSEIIKYYDGATVFPPKYFDPLGTGNSKDLLCNETISIHHYAASWTPFRQRIKRRFVNLIGYTKTQKLKKLLYRFK